MIYDLLAKLKVLSSRNSSRQFELKMPIFSVFLFITLHFCVVLVAV